MEELPLVLVSLPLFIFNLVSWLILNQGDFRDCRSHLNFCLWLENRVWLYCFPYFQNCYSRQRCCKYDGYNELIFINFNFIDYISITQFSTNAVNNYKDIHLGRMCNKVSRNIVWQMDIRKVIQFNICISIPILSSNKSNEKRNDIEN